MTTNNIENNTSKGSDNVVLNPVNSKTIVLTKEPQLPSLDLYLHSSNSILEIIKYYIEDLKKHGRRTNNKLEFYHASFLERYLGVISNFGFVDGCQQDIEEGCLTMMGNKESDLSFTIVGRVKSLFRVESKFNDYIQSFVKKYYLKHGRFPSVQQIINHLTYFRDFVAFRLILQDNGHNHEHELIAMTNLANSIPSYFDTASFSAHSKGGYTMLKAKPIPSTNPSMLKKELQPYYKDYVSNPTDKGFRAYTICMQNNLSALPIELQLVTFDMLQINEHSPELVHHKYEDDQKAKRLATHLPEGISNKLFEEAHERIVRLETLDLTKVNVNMFQAFPGGDVEDLCGLVKGRQVKPFTYL